MLEVIAKLNNKLYIISNKIFLVAKKMFGFIVKNIGFSETLTYSQN